MIHIKKEEINKLTIFDNDMKNKIMRFIDYLDKAEFVTGKIVFKEDDELFCYAQNYSTHAFDINGWEKHELYYDVQYIQIGKELVNYNPLCIDSIIKAYDSISDCEIVRAHEGVSKKIIQGEIIIFEPGEYHNTGVICDNESIVRKFVIKCKR